MNIELKPGEKLTISFFETDGQIEVEYGEDKLTVTTDLPDSSGRQGEIYNEFFGKSFVLIHYDQGEPCVWCGDKWLITDSDDPNDEDWTYTAWDIATRYSENEKKLLTRPVIGGPYEFVEIDHEGNPILDTAAPAKAEVTETVI